MAEHRRLLERLEQILEGTSVPEPQQLVELKPPKPALKTTGIQLLDRILEGGLPGGTTVYFSADPRFMSEVFLYQIANARKTYYFTTARKSKYVTQSILGMEFDIDTISYIDVYSQYFLDAYGRIADVIGDEFKDKEIIDFTESQLSRIFDEAAGQDVNLIFDNFSFYMTLNVNFGRVVRLCNIIYEVTKELDGLSFLYIIRGRQPQELEYEIMSLCDAVFMVELDRVGDRLSPKLTIPKLRGRPVKAEYIRFRIGKGIEIDTSREIG